MQCVEFREKGLRVMLGGGGGSVFTATCVRPCFHVARLGPVWRRLGSPPCVGLVGFPIFVVGGCDRQSQDAWVSSVCGRVRAA